MLAVKRKYLRLYLLNRREGQSFSLSPLLDSSNLFMVDDVLLGYFVDISAQDISGMREKGNGAGFRAKDEKRNACLGPVPEEISCREIGRDRGGRSFWKRILTRRSHVAAGRSLQQRDSKNFLECTLIFQTRMWRKRNEELDGIKSEDNL